MPRCSASVFFVILLATGAAAQTTDGPLAPLPSRTSGGSAPAFARGDASGGDASIEVLSRWPYGYARSVALGADGLGLTMQGSVFQTLDLSDPSNIGVLAEMELPGVVSDMAAEGTLVAVMTTHFQEEDTGLFVVDVSDPLAPRLRGRLTGLNATSVLLRDGIAYVGTYETSVGGPDLSLRLVSLADPDAPVQVGVVETPSFVDHIAIDGERAYLAMNVAGLGVVDISTPTAPVLTGTPEAAYTGAVAVSETGTLVAGSRDASGDGILRFYDLTNPDVPAEVGSVALERENNNAADPLDATWVGSDVIVAGLFGGLQFVDAAVPSAPSFLVRRSTSKAFVASGTNRLATDGTRLLVADFYSGVHQGDPAQRQLTAYMSVPNLALDAVVDDETGEMYIAEGTYGVVVLARTASGEALEVTDRIHTSAWNYTSAVAQTGGFLYAADGYGGIWTIDKATRATTSNVLRNTPIRQVAVTDDGSLLLAARDECTVLDMASACTVYVFSLADPATPERVATIVPPAGASGLGGSGPVLWVGDFSNTRLRLYDATDPADPQPGGSVSLTGSGFTLARDGDRLYALGTGLVANILDVSAPASPVVLGAPQSVGRQETLAAQGDVLVLAGFGLAAYDVADPTQTVQTAFSDDFGDVQSGITFVERGLALVAANHAGAYLVATPVPTAGEGAPLASGVRLHVAPNPTRGALVVEIESGSPEALDVAVYDVLGRRVRTLATGLRVAGEEALAWDGRSEGGAPLAPGVYVVRVRSASGAAATERVTILR